MLATIHAGFFGVSMTIFARRKFLAGAGACSLSSFFPFGRWEGADGSADPSIVADEDELTHGCFFARLDPERSPAEEEPAAASVDFWTFRVSEIDSGALPASAGRVIIWDDVFLSRDLSRNLKSILKALPQWYGFDPLFGRCSFHLDGFGEIGQTIQAILPETTRTIPLKHLALIDIDSCGVSRFDWPDILRHLHNCYDVIVGFAHFPGRWPSHHQEPCEGALDNSRTAKALACCDLSFWTTDSLLGFDEVLDYDTRAPFLNALVHDLIHALSAADLIRMLAATPEATQFVVSRLRSERSHGRSSSDLQYDAEGAPLIGRKLVL